jgi:light-regulated signal transduction histidine kinase (bacteriophytochrome)
VHALPATLGDAGLLRQALSNLIENAFKFTRRQPKARIEIGSRVEGAETVYYVRDNGAGFDMKYATKLFGVFQRLHGESDFDGTGVGLALVQRIVHRHGGRVWAQAAVDQGATFYFTLRAK